MENFLSDMQSSELKGFEDLSYKVINHLRTAIHMSKGANTANELIEAVLKEGRKILLLQSNEHSVQNIVLRVLKIIREECVKIHGHSEDLANKETLHKMLTTHDFKESFDLPTKIKELKGRVIEMINEYVDEIKLSVESIAAQGIEHIHADELILTIGYNACVEEFLTKTAPRRNFRVVVAEGCPSYGGHNLAKQLIAANIETTVINDSAIFAVMSRVNKVILGTSAMFANGGLKATIGSHLVALAAKEHSVPLYVLAPIHKLSPEHHSDITGKEIAFNKMLSPEGVLDYNLSGIEKYKRVEISNPQYDYVPPELVTLFITNQGGVAPLNLYQLLGDQYLIGDYNLLRR